MAGPALALLSLAVGLAFWARAGGGGAAALVPEFGLVCTDGPAFSLRASDGYISTPDGNSLYMWSFADAGGSNAFQYPGPTLCVTEGDTVSITLTNDLPEAVSILFPGQADVLADGVLAQPEFTGGTLTSLTDSVAPGGSITYSFLAAEPGTYLYESGTEPDKQIQMGLIGGIIVRPAVGSAYAYNDASTRFDAAREYLLLFHEIDPALHLDVEAGRPFDITTLHQRYWTINGRSLPDTIAPNNAPWLPSQPYGALVTIQPFDIAANPYPALVRVANPGVQNHPFHPHANHVRVIAQDGRLLQSASGEDLSLEKFGRTTGAGQTIDALFSWTDVDAWNAIDNPVPVVIPGLQNLVFKDGQTFFSGSPYLGDSGELPVGTTSFNQCGEMYFPWHSHALNEFENFDEGFGGLATLLRVDPPGGC